MPAHSLKERTRADGTQAWERARRIAAAHVLLLVGLLVLPAAAPLKSGADWRWIVGYLLLVNTITFWVYGRDKRQAREGEWRVPELKLHLLEFVGGWPAAFLAQRHFRHKCSKVSYQLVFWGIVLAFQFVALDCLRGGNISNRLWQRIEVALHLRK